MEIHKLDKLKFDEESEYLGIENTVAKDKNLQDILSAGYRPDTHEVIPFRFKEDVHLRASSRGLDVLIDHFGQRIAVIKLKENNKRYGGPNPELANMYDVVIKDVARNDWYDLITLWLRYPADDITVMKDSKNLLVFVQYQIENRIKAIK